MFMRWNFPHWPWVQAYFNYVMMYAFHRCFPKQWTLTVYFLLVEREQVTRSPGGKGPGSCTGWQTDRSVSLSKNSSRDRGLYTTEIKHVWCFHSEIKACTVLVTIMWLTNTCWNWGEMPWAFHASSSFCNSLPFTFSYIIISIFFPTWLMSVRDPQNYYILSPFFLIFLLYSFNHY